MRRYINADGLIGPQGNLLNHNMYAYCQNNPVMYVDPSGYFKITLTILAISAFVRIAGNMLNDDKEWHDNLIPTLAGAYFMKKSVILGAFTYAIGTGVEDYIKGESWGDVGKNYVMNFATSGISGAIGNKIIFKENTTFAFLGPSAPKFIKEVKEHFAGEAIDFLVFDLFPAAYREARE